MREFGKPGPGLGVEPVPLGAEIGRSLHVQQLAVAAVRTADGTFGPWVTDAVPARGRRLLRRRRGSVHATATKLLWASYRWLCALLQRLYFASCAACSYYSRWLLCDGCFHLLTVACGVVSGI